MKIKTMKALVGLVNGHPQTAEIEVEASFSEVISGEEFKFCLHGGSRAPRAMALSHYESGCRVADVSYMPPYGEADAGHLTLTDEEIVQKAREVVRHIAARMGPEKLHRTLQKARPIVNGCTPCHGTGWATVGGPCITCQGSGDAMNPGREKHVKQ